MVPSNGALELQRRPPLQLAAHAGAHSRKEKYFARVIDYLALIVILSDFL
jgi:hypothetical protein